MDEKKIFIASKNMWVETGDNYNETTSILGVFESYEEARKSIDEDKVFNEKIKWSGQDLHYMEQIGDGSAFGISYSISEQEGYLWK